MREIEIKLKAKNLNHLVFLALMKKPAGTTPKFTN